MCLGITRDVMRLQAEKKPLGQMRAFIDQSYGRSGGPPTPTPRPPE
jgi:hypothetical protein